MVGDYEVFMYTTIENAVTPYRVACDKLGDARKLAREIDAKTGFRFLVWVYSNKTRKVCNH